MIRIYKYYTYENTRYQKYGCACFLLAALTLMSPAQSQSLQWSAPGDGFDLTIPKGWVQTPPSELQIDARSQAILLIAPKGVIFSESAMGCSIFKLDHTAPSEVTQAAANAVLQSWDQSTVTEQMPEIIGRVFDVSNFTNKPRNGVQSISLKYSAELNGTKTKYAQVQFMLATGGAAASFMTISCFAPSNLNDEDLRKINAFLSSLTFKKRVKP